MIRHKRLPSQDKPGTRLFSKHCIVGVDRAFVTETYNNETGELVDTSMPWYILEPLKKVLIQISKYRPHQGKQERTRRQRQIKKGIIQCTI